MQPGLFRPPAAVLISLMLVFGAACSGASGGPGPNTTASATSQPAAASTAQPPTSTAGPGAATPAPAATTAAGAVSGAASQPSGTPGATAQPVVPAPTPNPNQQ